MRLSRKLTRREVVIVKMLVKGERQVTIAKYFNISQPAVSKRLRVIRVKLNGYKNRLKLLKDERGSFDYDELYLAEQRVKAWHDWFYNEIVCKV